MDAPLICPFCECELCWFDYSWECRNIKCDMYNRRLPEDIYKEICHWSDKAAALDEVKRESDRMCQDFDNYHQATTEVRKTSFLEQIFHRCWYIKRLASAVE